MSEQVQQATHIRRVKLEDKEDVLKIHGNVHDGLDCLPAYYDYFVSRPNIYSVAVFYNEKMVSTAKSLSRHSIYNDKTRHNNNLNGKHPCLRLRRIIRNIQEYCIQHAEKHIWWIYARIASQRRF